ncbi:hypothetical protein HS961_12700 [Comamonas piscis]|uniref:Uncharacterized protein n=1 Tax=Comamonas piscis TaxID=1562974 RepID=A0A7G5EHZ3_9BURK|nr:hypothetical protein [Comamonas piscis]QMV73618.1 hypothetical protein HS961_12700 [Comamonas piscis]WSO32040.1 hypothetical protein VUJ63_12735 [Comamonas piscis]
MNAKRTEPRTHTYQRRPGAYVGSGHDASHLAAVFAAERERLANEAAKSKRRRKPKAEAMASTDKNPNQLCLVA